MEGYVTLLHFGALFLVLYGTLRTPEAYKKILWVSVLISVVQCFYAFGQLPGIDIQATKLYASTLPRISGTFGNPDFFPLYLIFQIFFAIMLFLWEKQIWWRVVLVGVCLIDGVAIFFSGTRGAMLGMYAGIGLIALGSLLFSGNRKLRLRILVALVLVAVLLGALYTFRDSKIVQDHYILQRATIFAGSNPAISRWMAWKIVLPAWQDRFWFGYGLDNLSYVFNHYYNPEILLYTAGEFDRSHNRFVDALVTGGVVGLVMHLAMFATAGWFLLKQWWLNRGGVFPLVGLALLVAYFVELCTLFDHIISYQYFAIFLALLATWEVQSIVRAPQTLHKLRVLVPPWDKAERPIKLVSLPWPSSAWCASCGRSIFYQRRPVTGHTLLPRSMPFLKVESSTMSSRRSNAR